MKNFEQYENQYFDYGECPNCGAMCQPDGFHNGVELAVCCDCSIWWHVHSEGIGQGNGDHKFAKYMVSDIEEVVEPYGC